MSAARGTSSGGHAAEFRGMLAKAIDRRRGVIERLRGGGGESGGSGGRAATAGNGIAFRAFSGSAEGVDGVFVDVYGEGAVLIVYEGRAPAWFRAAEMAEQALEALTPLGVKAVYHKHFARDRSKMGGELPPEVMESKPAAGEALPEATLIRELEWTLEVQLYGGLSTGLFLDQRENRGFVSRWVKARGAGRPAAVLNTFAYTCAFSVAAAAGGAIATSVDVSARYLEWGKRNFVHNGLDPALHRFAKMDTFEFFDYAMRKELRYDLIILDPPSFAAGSKKKGIRPFSSTADYAKLVRGAAALLHPRGVILASTNTQELCMPRRLEREIVKGLGKEPRWLKLPPSPEDFANERERFAARAFAV